MPAVTTTPDRVNNPLVMFVLTWRDAIIWVTPLVAIGSASGVSAVDGWGDFSWTEFIGLAATIYSALLAIFIFVASTASNTGLAQELDASRETIKGSYEKSGVHSKQSSQELALAKANFAGYLDALQEKYKIPDVDIIEVKRPDSEARGNRPVFIKTRLGHEYSVWRGGPKAAYYVTDLGSSEN